MANKDLFWNKVEKITLFMSGGNLVETFQKVTIIIISPTGNHVNGDDKSRILQDKHLIL